MNTEMQSLRSLDVILEEHAELLNEAARAMPGLPPAEREELRAHVLSFLQHELGDHLRMDERLLYPKIAERLGDPLAPAPLNYDNRAIRWCIDEIAGADINDVPELQRLLYGLHVLIKVHLSREQDLYLGALESPAWPAEG